MNAPIETADEIERIVSTLPADAAFLAAAWQAYASGSAATLDEALGLKSTRGREDWRNERRRRERNRHLRAAAAHFDYLEPTLAASLIALEMGEYCRGAWQRERTAKECPPRLRGLVEEHYWCALNSWPNVLGERAIYNVITEAKP